MDGGTKRNRGRDEGLSIEDKSIKLALAPFAESSLVFLIKSERRFSDGILDRFSVDVAVVRTGREREVIGFDANGDDSGI